MSVLDEKFSCLEIEGLPHMFRISEHENKQYIYYFDNQKKERISFNDYMAIKDKMKQIAGMSESKDYSNYFSEIQKLLNVWKHFFPVELRNVTERDS